MDTEMGTVCPKWGIYISPSPVLPRPRKYQGKGGIKNVYWTWQELTTAEQDQPVKIPLLIKDGLTKAPPLAEEELRVDGCWGGRLFFGGMWSLGGCLCSDGCLYFYVHGDSTIGFWDIYISISVYDMKLGCVWRESWERWRRSGR